MENSNFRKKLYFRAPKLDITLLKTGGNASAIDEIQTGSYKEDKVHVHIERMDEKYYFCRIGHHSFHLRCVGRGSVEIVEV